MHSKRARRGLAAPELLEEKKLLAAQPLIYGEGLDRQIDIWHKLYNSDNLIDRREAVYILKSAKDGGFVSGAEITHLRQIFEDSNMPDYVRYFGKSIVEGSSANGFFQGAPLGDLIEGSSSDHMQKLIDKWFMGKDHPSFEGWPEHELSYQHVAGELFVNGPGVEDIKQGAVGDCYFIAGLWAFTGSTEDSSAAEKMFLDNGDDTWTVRFYAPWDYFTKHFVTVDRSLPVKDGKASFFASFGEDYSAPGNELWVALAEKAYVQFVSQIDGGRDNVEPNHYFSIRGGNVSRAMAAVKGSWCGWYRFNDPLRVIGSLEQGKTLAFAYNGHAYAITSYNYETEEFFMANPYGRNHMELTWEEIQERGIDGRPLIPATSVGTEHIAFAESRGLIVNTSLIDGYTPPILTYVPYGP